MVVLALGTRPRVPGPTWRARRPVRRRPVDRRALLARGRDAASVLLIGTGLTMVDVAPSCTTTTPSWSSPPCRGACWCPGRTGAAPCTRTTRSTPGSSSLDDLVAAVRRRIAEVEEIGGDWRDVVDAVRAYGNRIWQGFRARRPGPVRRRGVPPLGRVARHRMSPEMAAYIDGLLASGVLELAPAGTVDPTTYDLVVNCSGPAPVQTPGWNLLVDRLLARGVLTPHRLGLGIDLDRHGRPRGADGESHPKASTCSARPARGSSGRSPRSRTCARRRSRWPSTSARVTRRRTPRRRAAR